MKVFIEKENKYKTLKASTVKALLSKLNINQSTVLVVINNELVTEDAKLKQKDKVKLLSVVSGG